MSAAGQHAAGADPRPEATALLAKMSEIGSELMAAQEWGIFYGHKKDKTGPLEQDIISNLEAVKKGVDANDFAAAQTALLKAKAGLSRAQKECWPWWSANNRYGIAPLLCTAIGVWIAHIGIKSGTDLSPEHIAAGHAAYLGLAGATLRTLYWLQHQINRGQLRPRWMAYFLVAPAVGGLLGAFSFLIVVVGSKLAVPSAAGKVDDLAVGLFAAFAGYNWEWALDKFLVAANAVGARFSAKSVK